MPSKKRNVAVTDPSLDSVSAINRPNLGRHEARCRVCSHCQRPEIESEFVDWASPASIAARYKIDRASVYRHAHALNLFGRRRRNLRRALERVVERVGDVPVNAGAVVAAAQLLAKLNSRGQLLQREEFIDLRELFDRLSPQELGRYASTGELPHWFKELIGPTDPPPDAGDDHD